MLLPFESNEPTVLVGTVVDRSVFLHVRMSISKCPKLHISCAVQSCRAFAIGGVQLCAKALINGLIHIGT